MHRCCNWMLVLLVGASLATAQDYRELDWLDLLPEADLQALLNAPPVSHDTPELSWEESISRQVEQSLLGTGPQSEWERAMQSTAVVGELNGTRARLPGYIVPLEFDDRNRVTEFFLVPYFGACIHVPPPPPNQIVHMAYPPGLEQEALWVPYWVEGTLTTETEINSVAVAAYSMQVDAVEEYEE